MEINWDTIEFEFINHHQKDEEEDLLMDIHEYSPDSTLSAIDEMDFDEDIEEIIKESFQMNVARNPKRKQKNGTKNFSCDICDVKLPSQSYLKRHYTTKGHQRKLMKKKEVKSERIEELTELTNDEKELLALFDEQISQFQNLDELIIKEEVIQPVIVPKITTGSLHCEPCDKFFTHRCHYTQHVKTVHSGFKAFKCQKCGKKFATESELNSHAAKHEGLKPFKCPQCPKSYNNKVDLKRHEKNHDKNAPHPCEICSRGFVRRDHLEKHYESHKRKGAKQLKSAYENGVAFM